nr:3408_t:CDS:2 [Entrophospora candida]
MDDNKHLLKISEVLQDPDEKKRNKALKKLCLAIRKPVTLDQKVAINLWKGSQVSNLEIFVIEFWNKMCYEWLKRRVLNGILNCGVTNNWQILPIISNVISHLISSQISTIPDGIKYHFCDIYVDELINVAEQESYKIPLSELIIPFVWALKDIKNKILISNIKAEVFNKLISQIPKDNIFLKDQLMEIHGELIKVTESKEISSKARKTAKTLLQEFIKVIGSFKIVSSNDLNNNFKKRKIEEIETPSASSLSSSSVASFPLLLTSVDNNESKKCKIEGIESSTQESVIEIAKNKKNKESPESSISSTISSSSTLLNLFNSVDNNESTTETTQVSAVIVAKNDNDTPLLNLLDSADNNESTKITAEATTQESAIVVPKKKKKKSQKAKSKKTDSLESSTSYEPLNLFLSKSSLLSFSPLSSASKSIPSSSSSYYKNNSNNNKQYVKGSTIEKKHKNGINTPNTPTASTVSTTLNVIKPILKRIYTD